jgi:hypothetical protein
VGRPPAPLLLDKILRGDYPKVIFGGHSVELLVRWTCPCVAPRDGCSHCRGKGYLERWMPRDLLRPLLGSSDFLIVDRSHTKDNVLRKESLGPLSEEQSVMPVDFARKRESRCGSTLYVDGLPPSFKNLQLRELFAAAGTVLWSRIVAGARGQGSGFGYVEMKSPDEAQKAAKTLDGYKVDDYSLAVMISSRAPQALQAERFLELNTGKCFCELCIRSHLDTATSSTEILDAFSYLYECYRYQGTCFECQNVIQVFAVSPNGTAQA